MKGVFNERPTLPRYKSVWDVQVVLDYLEHFDTATLLSLSCKVCILFLLLTAQRCQTLHVLKLSDIHVLPDKLIVNVSSLLKQSRPGMHQGSITLKAYTLNNKLCIVETIKEYLNRTQNLRNGDFFLISTVKPHNAVTSQTISRWVKLIMRQAGITDKFKPHSTRAASTSAALEKGVPLLDIIKTAGWSNAKTFAKYYHKQIDNDSQFQTKILS